MIIKWWIRKKNSKKAAAMLRRLLTVDEKGLPEVNIEFGYVNSIPEETAKKQVAAYYRQERQTAQIKQRRKRNMKGLTVENIISIYGKATKEVKVFNEGKRTAVGDFLQIEPVAFALADEKDVLRIYVDEESAAASLDGTLQDVKPEEDGRKKAIKRTRNLVYCFADFMLKEEEKAEKEKAEIEKMMKEAEASGRVVYAVSCAENNIRCMHNCMKAANDVVDYLTNKENEVEEWQIAAINAMYDTCRTMEPGQTVIPYDLPYAIKGLLLQWDNK